MSAADNCLHSISLPWNVRSSALRVQYFLCRLETKRNASGIYRVCRGSLRVEIVHELRKIAWCKETLTTGAPHTRARIATSVGDFAAGKSKLRLRSMLGDLQRPNPCVLSNRGTGTFRSRRPQKRGSRKIRRHGAACVCLLSPRRRHVDVFQICAYRRYPPPDS